MKKFIWFSIKVRKVIVPSMFDWNSYMSSTYLPTGRTKKTYSGSKIYEYELVE